MIRPVPRSVVVDGHVGGSARRRTGRSAAVRASPRRRPRGAAARRASRAPPPELRGHCRARSRVRLLTDDHASTVGRVRAPDVRTRRLTCEDSPMTWSPPADSAFLRAAAASRCRTPRCGSCARPAARCRSTSLREGVGMLESCMDPDLVTEITLQPVRRYGVDAAIFFSDIVLPLKAVGVDLDIKPGVGPVVAKPVRTLADVEAIPDLTTRARPLHHRGGPPAGRRARRHAADRLRRRAVHGRVVPRRGRAVQGARARPRR
jgi:hypothetical protein